MKNYYFGGYANGNYRNKYRKARAQSYTDRLISFLQAMIRIVESDGFATAFYGVSFLLIAGIVGAVEFGRLSVADSIRYSSLVLSAVGIVIYRNNRHR